MEIEAKKYFIEQDFPLDLRFSLEKIGAYYKELSQTSAISTKEHANQVIQILNDNPDLVNGITNTYDVLKYSKEIDDVLSDLFPIALQQNEIKFAAMPFQEDVFKASLRYENIITAAGEDFKLEIKNFDEDHYYIMGCSIILMQYYQYKIDFRRPFFYEIPDINGVLRYYRMLYNGDYTSIEKKEETPILTQEDVDLLIDNFDSISLWKEKFPPNGYLFKGFVIANLYDATTDVSISNFKSGLLRYEQEEVDFTSDFEKIFQAIFNISELSVGFSNYNEEENTFELVPFTNISSYLLYGDTKSSCNTVLCMGSYNAVFETGKYFAISDVENIHTKHPNVKMYENLNDQGIRSVILAPIRSKGKLLGIMELASPRKRELNSINANKLDDLMPYLIDSVLRNKAQQENEIELVIQNECTSIHKSVYWKFEQEAKRFIKLQLSNDPNAQFRDVVFRDVYPLFGQVDFRGSSEARNKATQQDILLQLSNAIYILKEAYLNDPLPVYEQLIFHLNTFYKDISTVLEVDSERKVLNFLKHNIQPLFSHFLVKNDVLNNLVVSYRDQIEDNLGLVYKYRKIYDDTVTLLNKRMASVLKKKQKEAQKIYPHYFELFKTDGVEHNMYVGESITKEDSFNKIYLYNLRLWQLQLMCEMENVHFKLSRKQENPLEVASMILVFNNSLSVRYRMDEKRFDVDGTYNARYEVVKKRVDKAYIKGTEERVTQPGKLAIVYSQKEDEEEYLRYVSFLQTKKYFGNEVEIVELQDLQAVTGLKAIRVNILYSIDEKGKPKKDLYTYNDLLQETIY